MVAATARERANARRRHRDYVKLATVSDITPEQEMALRKKARNCPLCGVRMTSKPNLPNSKELDHILPINQGGTHTHGNVRIICRQCNQRRPKDGSDYTGMLTLWAQGPAPVSRPNRNANTQTCRKGLHPWTPENIQLDRGKKRCKPCRVASEQKRGRSVPQQCKCGAPFMAKGNTLMCPACTDAAGRKAAELHAAGMPWKKVAAEVGYRSDQGVIHAARRIGYRPEKRPAKGAPAKGAPPGPPCDGCGQATASRRGRPGKAGPLCPACLEARAWQAVELRLKGDTLEAIASQLGYSSKSSVTNLMNTLVAIEDARMGRPPITHHSW